MNVVHFRYCTVPAIILERVPNKRKWAFKLEKGGKKEDRERDAPQFKILVVRLPSTDICRVFLQGYSPQGFPTGFPIEGPYSVPSGFPKKFPTRYPQCEEEINEKEWEISIKQRGVSIDLVLNSLLQGLSVDLVLGGDNSDVSEVASVVGERLGEVGKRNVTEGGVANGQVAQVVASEEVLTSRSLVQLELASQVRPLQVLVKVLGGVDVLVVRSRPVRSRAVKVGLEGLVEDVVTTVVEVQTVDEDLAQKLVLGVALLTNVGLVRDRVLSSVGSKNSVVERGVEASDVASVRSRTLGDVASLGEVANPDSGVGSSDVKGSRSVKSGDVELDVGGDGVVGGGALVEELVESSVKVNEGDTSLSSNSLGSLAVSVEVEVAAVSPQVLVHNGRTNNDGVVSVSIANVNDVLKVLSVLVDANVLQLVVSKVVGTQEDDRVVNGGMAEASENRLSELVHPLGVVTGETTVDNVVLALVLVLQTRDNAIGEVGRKLGERVTKENNLGDEVVSEENHLFSVWGN